LTCDRSSTSSRCEQLISLQNDLTIISLGMKNREKIDRIYRGLDSIVRELKTDEFDKHLETCEKLRKKFKLCVVDFCHKLDIKQDAAVRYF
ncbi:MAG: hypothetical protein LBB43_01550, partial [Spirochaetaceae bacterium]|nr:hypothetical protein [Spirochaetaceae bacterium]